MRSIKLPSWTERLLGFEPLPAPPDVFSLDDRQLRHARILPSPDGYVVDDFRAVDLPEGCQSDGSPGSPFKDPKLFWEVLQDLVQGLRHPIKEASLVLPDSWLRLIFTELAEIPKGTVKQDEILRWKLKRLVPFRVEDLRISARPVTPFPVQEEEHRLMVGFAMESLMTQLEEGFSGVGIELGQVTNTSLALLASLEPAVGPGDLAALISVGEDEYNVSIFLAGEPLLYRHKTFSDEMAYATRQQSVYRNVRLTTSFVAEHFPESPLTRVFVAAPPELEEHWLSWLGSELEVEPEALDYHHFSLAVSRMGASFLETAPMLGAASLRIA